MALAQDCYGLVGKARTVARLLHAYRDRPEYALTATEMAVVDAAIYAANGDSRDFCAASSAVKLHVRRRTHAALAAVYSLLKRR